MQLNLTTSLRTFSMFKIWKIVLICIVLSIGSLSSELVDGAEQQHLHLRVPTARITLNSFETGVLRTITEKVNHEVVLTVQTAYSQAYVFQCNATYPVEWNYVGEGAPRTSADVGRQFKDFYNVNTYTYQAILYMYQLEELQSGRYVCRGSNPEQEKLQVHYDLFVPGNGSQVLISNGEKKIFVPESKLLTSLPCEVTDPSLTVNLYKGDDWGVFQKLDINDSIVFRPRKGFILKLHELPDPFGTYMCATPDNKRRRKLHLIPERLREKYEAGNSLNGKVPVQMSYDYEYNRMICCSGTSFIPRLQWANCGNVLDCKIKSVCFEEDRCGDIDELSGDGGFRDPGQVPKGCVGWKLKGQMDHGILKCSTPGVTQYQPYLLNRGHIFTNFEVAPPSETILTLTKTSSDSMYLGSEVEYICNSTRFYFAYGIRWAFKRGNDDIEFVDDSSTYVVRDKYSLTSHKRHTTFRILHPDIKAIICFVPIANSPTEWRTVSLPIVIRDALHSPSINHQEVIHAEKDYQNNRISHVPQDHQQIPQHFQHHQQQKLGVGGPHQLFEPFSTSRTKSVSILNNPNLNHLPPNHIIDPTPSVDIADIIDKRPPPIQVPMIPIDSLSQVDDRDRDYLYSSPISHHQRPLSTSPNFHNENVFSKESYNFPKESHNFPKENHFSAVYGHAEKKPHYYHSDQKVSKNDISRVYQRPRPIEGTESIHGIKYMEQNHHQIPSRYSNSNEGLYSNDHYHHYSTSTTIRPRPASVVASQSIYSKPKPTTRSKYPQYDYKDHDIITLDDLHKSKPAMLKPPFKYNSVETFREDPNVYSTSTMATPYYNRNYNNNNDRGYTSERDSLETFSPIRTTPIPQSRPIIHYNSKEKEYGLRDPGMITSEERRKWTEALSSPITNSAHMPLDSYQRSSEHRGHQHNYQRTTTSSPLKHLPYGSEHLSQEEYSPRRRTHEKHIITHVEAKLSVVPEEDMDSPYSSDDYYISSLRAKERRHRLKSASTTSLPHYHSSRDQNGAASSHHHHHQQQFHNLRHPTTKSNSYEELPKGFPSSGEYSKQRDRESAHHDQRPYIGRTLRIEGEGDSDNYYFQRYGEQATSGSHEGQSNSGYSNSKVSKDNSGIH